MTSTLTLLLAAILWPALAAPEPSGITGWAGGVGAGRMELMAELDWRLWQTLTARHGRPLEIELR